MKKLLTILTLALTFSFQVSASECKTYFKKSEFCFSVEWVEGPRAYKESQFELKFWNKNTRELETPENLEVYLWMPSMNHGSRPVTIEPTGTGKFLVANVFFIMTGPWEIKFKVRGEFESLFLTL